jgi:hypothetical protein
VAYVRTVRTGSGATAVQIVHGSRRRSRDVEHLGSAHDAQAVEALKAVARQRLAGRHADFPVDHALSRRWFRSCPQCVDRGVDRGQGRGPVEACPRYEREALDDVEQ